MSEPSAPADREASDEPLRRLITDLIGPPDHRSLSDSEVEAMLDAADEWRLSEDQIALILRKMDAEITYELAAETKSASLDPNVAHTESLVPMPPPSPPAPTSPVLGFLGDVMHGNLHLPGSLLTLLALISSALTLVVLCVIAIRGVHVQIDPPNSGQVAENGGQQQNSPPTPGHRVRALSAARLASIADCLWADDSQTPAMNDELAVGGRLQLKSGLAEVVFQSGARVLLKGPTSFEIGGPKSGYLHHGSLCATCETPTAKGFEIHAPGMKFTDLGTEFGVSVAKDGAQEVHVFRGSVVAEAEVSSPPVPQFPVAVPADSQPPIPNPKRLILTTNQSARIEKPAAIDAPPVITRAAAAPERFVRTIPQPDSFALFSTGAGLSKGDKDPHWELIAISTDPTFKPQSAVVVRPEPKYPRISGDMGHWISISDDRRKMPTGCRWTFRTQFDLTGFDPATARIEGQFGADDYLVGLRLNGEPLPLPEGSKARGEGVSFIVNPTPLQLDHGSVGGLNTLEIEIENINDNMELYIDWKGTAKKTRD